MEVGGRAEGLPLGIGGVMPAHSARPCTWPCHQLSHSAHTCWLAVLCAACLQDKAETARAKQARVAAQQGTRHASLQAAAAIAAAPLRMQPPAVTGAASPAGLDAAVLSRGPLGPGPGPAVLSHVPVTAVPEAAMVALSRDSGPGAAAVTLSHGPSTSDTAGGESDADASLPAAAGVLAELPAPAKRARTKKAAAGAAQEPAGAGQDALLQLDSSAGSGGGGSGSGDAGAHGPAGGAAQGADGSPGDAAGKGAAGGRKKRRVMVPTPGGWQACRPTLWGGHLGLVR